MAKKRKPQDATIRNVRASNRRSSDLLLRLHDLSTKVNDIHKLILELQADMQKLKPQTERRKR
jgi:hypothetical protein